MRLTLASRIANFPAPQGKFTKSPKIENYLELDVNMILACEGEGIAALR